MKRLFSEPLVHFLLLGAVLFVAFQFTGRARAPERKRIEITPGVIEHLGTTFARTWQRPPTEEEMTGLVREYLREEIAYREGQALGLDRDDSVIRRRMRQKLEMLSGETATEQEPDDAVLEAFMRAAAARYAVDPSVAFTQVYVNPERHAADLDAILGATREKLGAGRLATAELAELGDATALPSEVALAPRWQVARDFGDAFADAVLALETDAWSAPLRSAFGLHFVRVREKQPGRMPELAAVRDVVLRDWQAQRRQQAMDRLYEDLLSGYEVVFPQGGQKQGVP